MGWGGEDVNSILNTSFFINCSFLGDFYAENIIEKRKEKKKEWSSTEQVSNETMERNIFTGILGHKDQRLSGRQKGTFALRL